MRKADRPTYTAGAEREALARQLLNWFAVHQRDLPWRRSRDPYRIWVSEVMLQQTRVEAVRPYYERWFERFPTPEDLAEAPEDDVLKAWEGLGYYSRARNLHSAVREVVERYGGEVPDDPEAVRSLPGVGPYTAGAILSIAFNRSEPAVDGNVLRVLARIYAIADDIMKSRTRTAMEALARELIPPGQAGAFNQALMELGALICTPTSPKCAVCPVASVCRAQAEGLTDQLPVRSKARAPRPVDMVTGVLRRADGRLLLVRRPSEGLLGGLWEFPSGERPTGMPWERAVHHLFQERFGCEVEVEAHLTDVKHIFTHLVWHLRAFTCTLAAPEIPESNERRWVAKEDLHQFALPVAHAKVLASL